jgi:8-oxo-dGTP pyrophosphatase MutT (NUDIX family)
MNEPRVTTKLESRTPLRAASTAIVLREQHGEIQVLMTRRHAALAFMGGMWVFPGGTLTAADQSEQARNIVFDADHCAFGLRDIAGQALQPRTCVALAIAACRETFEEAGVLLARRTDGSPCTLDQLARLQAKRSALAADPVLFIATLEREALHLDVEHLIYWAHWITPSSGARRFDTRFFVARAPASYDLTADTYETTECIWMSPAKLLEQARARTMSIAQPTRYNLEDLRVSIEQHGTLEALLRAEAKREVSTIMPKLLNEDGRTIIVMPWDPGYEATPGEGVSSDQKHQSVLLALPSRVELDH